MLCKPVLSDKTAKVYNDDGSDSLLYSLCGYCANDLFRIPFNSAEDSMIKRCPTCHVPIERDSGCAQMMCKRCKHVFCWYCLTSLDVSARIADWLQML